MVSTLQDFTRQGTSVRVSGELEKAGEEDETGSSGGESRMRRSVTGVGRGMDGQSFGTRSVSWLRCQPRVKSRTNNFWYMECGLDIQIVEDGRC